MDEELVLVTVSVMSTLAMLGLIGAYAARYKKVPPNTAMVVYGRHFPGGRGYAVLMSGGKFIVPIMESFRLISLEPVRIDLVARDVDAAASTEIREASRFQVSVSATIKVSADKERLERAAGQLLHKSRDEIKGLAEQTVEAHVREVLATEPRPESDARGIAERIRAGAAQDLAGMGIDVQSFFLKIRPAQLTDDTDGSAFDSIRGELREMNIRIDRIEQRLGLTASARRP